MDMAVLGLSVDSSGVRRATTDLDRFGREGLDAERAANRVERSSTRMGAASRTAAVGIGRMVGMLGSLVSIGAVVRQADIYTGLQNSIQAMGKSTTEAAAAMDEIFRVSQATRAPMQATAKLYTRLSMAAGELGASEREVLTFTETVGKALAASGTSASEASGALLQLSQAMAGGVVRAEEFNSILEGAFPIAQAAADGIEAAAGSVGKLRQLVVEGKISSEEFFAAILSQAPQITKAFDETSVTVGQATTMLGNSFTNLIGKMNGETGMTGALAGVVMKLSSFVDTLAEMDNLQNIALGVGAVAAAFAAMVFPVAAAAAALTVGAIYIATHWQDLEARFPGIMGGITAAMDGAKTYISETWAPAMEEAVNGGLSGIEASIQAVKLALAGDWAAAWESAKAAFQGFVAFVQNINPMNRMADGIRAAAANVGASISSVWTGTIIPAVEGWAERMVAKGRDLVDGINEGVSAAAASVTEAFNSILATIQSTVAGWSGALVQAGRDLIDGFTRGIREKLGSVGEAVSGAAASAVNTVKSLLKIQSPSRVFQQLGEDTMEGYGIGIEAMADNVANEVAEAMEKAIAEAENAERELKARADRIIDSIGSNLLKGNGDLTDVWADIKDAGVDAFTDILKTSFAPGGDGIKGVMNGLTGAFQGVMQGLSTGGIGGIMSAVSSALPIIGAVVGVINLIKGFYTKETIGAGVTGTLGMDTAVRDFETTRHKILWGLISWTTETEKVNSELTGLMRDRTQMIRDSIIDIAATIGAGATDLSRVALDFKIDARDMSQDEIKSALEDQLTAYGDLVAQQIIQSEEYLRAGESYLDALKRMAEALPTVNAALDTMGQRMFDISIVGADAASALAELFGGVENFARSANTVFERFYTESERTALLTGKLSRDIADLGLAMPATRGEFIQLLESQALMTEKGRENYAALMQMAGAFDAILPKIVDFTTEVSSLISSAEEGANAARRTASEFERLFETLSDGARDLRRDAMPTQALFADQQREYQALLRRAMSGDAGAMGELTGSASALQSTFAQIAGSRAEFQTFSARLAAQISDVADLAGDIGETKNIEAESLDALIEALQKDDVTHKLLNAQISALDGMNASIVSQLIDLKSALTRQDNSAAQNAANATAMKIAQISSEAVRIVRQLEQNDIPNAVRMSDSRMVVFGPSWAETSDGKKFEASAFNPFREHEQAIEKARNYVDKANESRASALAKERSLEGQLDALRSQVRSLGATPTFATGGMHRGGLRIVGERGPEIEATGPSRIFSNSDTRRMLDFSGLEREMREARREIAALRDEQRQLGVQTVRNTRKTAQNLDKWDEIGLPQEQA
ncbi:tape measure protein [Maritimibacter sp. UBA3975]|uniref:tape measure protein n=1 Tax=Maritimibacter sp. UBA3975 TaxID=1946833 RepID=UPI000C0ABEB7|nr:tape measure protein [Maritimibacter sp. UBA3975]MAM60868.1 hypothetical protein [Maritimibacter sp.]|tara:strand:+ start:16602 stop:20612 length:4011 start_codon:yes stop_codon:yes gene_type:complete